LEPSQFHGDIDDVCLSVMVWTLGVTPCILRA
jgi:hypothetical protein